MKDIKMNKFKNCNESFTGRQTRKIIYLSNFIYLFQACDVVFALRRQGRTLYGFDT